jgi:DEAD/DEAH box helicase domain-containing protein
MRRSGSRARRHPHRDVSLREAGASYAILRLAAGEETELIGSIGAGNVFAECHEGAIYLHRGRQFHVAALDTERREVHVRAVRVPYYTRALSQKETEILARTRERAVGACTLVLGRVRVTTHTTGYERRRVHGQDLLASEKLELPPTAFESCGVWLEVPREVPAALEAQQRHPMGGLHAIEHAALSLFPLFALCDRHDVAGITYTRHPQLGGPAIFLYDAHAGGVGITASLFDRIESLLEAARELIADCECESGCPGCVHSPRCSNGNRPIDKAGAVQALAWLLGHEPIPAIALPAEVAPARPVAPLASASPRLDRAPRIVYFDLETQRSAAEVGGWHHAHDMRVAVAVIHDSAVGRYEAFDEPRASELLARLAAADLVVGFNVRRFDYAVLRRYAGPDPRALPTFDLLEDLHRRIGFRLPMGHLAEQTLGIPKSGDGLQSLAWWRAGDVARVTDYCQRDVEIVRALFEYALAHGHLRFRTRDGRLVRLPARWQLGEIVEAARAVQPRYRDPRPRRRRPSSSSKSMRALTGSAEAIVTATRSPSS